MAAADFEREFKERLRGARKIVVLAVGDELDPRDCLGILAGKKIESLRLRGVNVLVTFQMPENYTSVVKRLRPSHVVLIDAAEIGGKPGDVAFIDAEKVSATRVSTHAMPLSVLMDYLVKELGVKVALIGIQPASLVELGAGGQPIIVRKGIDRIAEGLRAAVHQDRDG